ncbi:MAG: hypothetical protein U5L72_06495 [Bacteroidales bacterium]|nr:hypothetical protein [Bacteroidales bacterium]
MAWDRISAANDTEANIPERITYNESISPSLVHYRTATPLLYNYDYGKKFPENWQENYFERIDKAISSAKSEDEKLLPLIEAARMEFLLRKVHNSTLFIDQLALALPDYAWIYYLKARQSFESGDFGRALSLIHRALECVEKAPALLQRYLLPVIEKGNVCDGRRITNYMWQSVYRHDNDYQVKALSYLSMELSGIIYKRRGERSRAIESFLLAN